MSQPILAGLIIGWLLALAGLWMAWHSRHSRKLHLRCVRLCHRIADELSRKQDPELVTDRVFQVVMEHTGASIGILTYRDNEEEPFKVMRVSGLPGNVLEPGTLLDAGICGWQPGAIEMTGKAQLIHHGLREAMAKTGVQLDRRQNMICIPVSAPNEVCGLLQLVSGPRQAFRKEQLNDLGGVGFYIYAAISNARMIATVKQQRDAAEAMYEIGLDISRSLDLDVILDHAVRQGLDLMGASFSWFLEYLPEEKEFARIRKATGAVPAPFCEGDQIKLAGRVLALLAPNVINHSVLLIDDLLKEITDENPLAMPENEVFCEPDALTHILKTGTRSAIIVRVGGPGQARGVLCSFATSPHFFKPLHVDLFKRLANQVLIALTNAEMYSRLSSITIIEERQRLSDELHDNMSQMINGVALEFHAIAKLVGEPNQTEKLMQRIDHIQNLLQDAKASIRQSIFELRLPEDSDLWQNLRQFLERFQHWHDLVVDSHLPQEMLHLPLDRQREVIRIVQEALWNARRHSGSSKTVITGNYDDASGQVMLDISDSGSGADTSQLHKGQGIATMQARAERLNGSLRTRNEPNAGFRLELEFPVNAKH